MRIVYIGVGVLDGRATDDREDTQVVHDDECIVLGQETLDASDLIEEELEWESLLLSAKRNA
jgi:hypothetical protein